MTEKLYTYGQHLASFPSLTTQQRQRLGVEPSGRPLDDDGVVGARTRRGLYIAPAHSHGLISKALWALLEGAREDGLPGGKQNNRGAWPALFMGNLADLPDDEDGLAEWRTVQQGPWCAGFASWCIREVYGAGQPQSLGARELVRKWGRKPGQVVALADAQPGDLIAWRREAPGEKAAGHVGIVYARDEASGLLLVLEGNGSRGGGAVGLYGYSLAAGAARGERKPQEVLMLSRRKDG